MKFILFLSIAFCWGNAAEALPPPEDIPEEVLRTEIILEARSPLDGKPLNAAEYAELQAQLQESKYPPLIASEIRQLLFELRLLHLFNLINPF